MVKEGGAKDRALVLLTQLEFAVNFTSFVCCNSIGQFGER